MATWITVLVLVVLTGITDSSAVINDDANAGHGFGNGDPLNVNTLLDAIQQLQTAVDTTQTRMNALEIEVQQQKSTISMQQQKLVSQESKMFEMKQEIGRMRAYARKSLRFREIEKEKVVIVEKKVEQQEERIIGIETSLKECTSQTIDQGGEAEIMGKGEGSRLNVSSIQKTVRQRRNTNKRLVLGGQVEYVAFSAYLSHDLFNLGPDHTIQFHGLILNEGNAYNQHTGIFTTPIDGIYLFSFSAQDYRPHRLWFKLVVDGELQSSVLLRPPQTNYHSQSTNVVILRLAVGQSVWIAVDSHESGDSLQGDATIRTTTFSGTLLYQ